MKILVLNCGSSSVKYKLYDMADESALARGTIERIRLDEAFTKVKLSNDEKKQITADLPTHKEGTALVFKVLLDPEFGALESLNGIGAVDHRIMQGGDLSEKSRIVTKRVETSIESLIDLAPVHNAGHLRGLCAIDALAPHTLQVAVFDNTLHNTMLDYAYLYAIPYGLYKKYHVRRCGFHGMSHRYVSHHACGVLGVDIKTRKIITCHVGNDASIAAIKGDKVIDTSMGLTPLAGLMMGSHSGDIDPSAVTYLMEKLGKKPREMVGFLNKECGVLGTTGTSSDMRDIGNADNAGDKMAHSASQMYTCRIRRYIGVYAVAMNGVNIIIWTAGVDKNQIGLRRGACQDMEYPGIKLNKERNMCRGGKQIFSTNDSKVKVVLVPIDEEITIARDTQELVRDLKK